MIHVSRLDGRPFVINAEIIQSLEKTPDTVVTLTNGVKLVIQESVDQVIDLVVDYRQHAYAFARA